MVFSCSFACRDASLRLVVHTVWVSFNKEMSGCVSTHKTLLPHHVELGRLGALAYHKHILGGG